MKKAREAGKKFGRPQKATDEEIIKEYVKFINKEIKAIEVYENLGISKGSYHSRIKEIKNKNDLSKKYLAIKGEIQEKIKNENIKVLELDTCYKDSLIDNFIERHNLEINLKFDF